jgi:hypothetical protein
MNYFMNNIKLLFSGDFAPLFKIEQEESNPFTDINELLHKFDDHITNLECPLTNNDQEIEKTGPTIKAQLDNVNILKEAKVSIACLANNHIFDFGEKGIIDTLSVCRDNGIDTIGIVNRPDGQPHWLIKEIKGKMIGFLNYCDHEFSVRGPRLLGACGYNAIDSYYDIYTFQKLVDYIIVIYHGGNEYYPLPNPALRKNYRYLADIGADVVIGHHTHVYSGYEIYNGKPLVYSLGNFFFPYPDEPEEWHLGLLCEINIGDEITATMHPIVQCEGKIETKLAGNPLKQNVLKEITKLSGLIVNDDDLQKSWNEFCERERTGYLKQFPCFSFPHRIALKLGIPMKRIISEKRLRNYENLLRCQAHSEIMKYALKQSNEHNE